MIGGVDVIFNRLSAYKVRSKTNNAAVLRIQASDFLTLLSKFDIDRASLDKFCKTEEQKWVDQLGVAIRKLL